MMTLTRIDHPRSLERAKGKNGELRSLFLLGKHRVWLPEDGFDACFQDGTCFVLMASDDWEAASVYLIEDGRISEHVMLGMVYGTSCPSCIHLRAPNAIGFSFLDQDWVCIIHDRPRFIFKPWAILRGGLFLPFVLHDRNLTSRVSIRRRTG